MRDRNIFVYKLLLSLNISNFSLFFSVKTGTPLKKSPCSFPATPTKNWDPAKPSFWKFGRRFNPSAEMGEVTMI